MTRDVLSSQLNVKQHCHNELRLLVSPVITLLLFSKSRCISAAKSRDHKVCSQCQMCDKCDENNAEIWRWDTETRGSDEDEWWMRMKTLRFVVEVDVAPQSTSELRFIDWTWTTTSHHPHFTSSHRPCQEPDLTDTQHFTSSHRPCQKSDVTSSTTLYVVSSTVSRTWCHRHSNVYYA